ncbi:MAG: AAA family ATPase [Myxococcales bacterium FL481]|nr:MAG: AAA family ATPase [Myxococcales bacterium FL481]
MALLGGAPGPNAEHGFVTADLAAVSERFKQSLRAGVRAIVLETHDEARALDMLAAVARELGWATHEWTAAGGWDRAQPLTLTGCLERARSHPEPQIIVLLDASSSLQGAADRRSLRELAQRTSGPALVLVERVGDKVPDIPELAHERLPAPDGAELVQTVLEIADAVGSDSKAWEALSGGRDAIARELIGLERFTAERVVAEALAATPDDPAQLMRSLRARKLQAVGSGSVLEFVAPAPVDELGGMSRLKAWLSRRALAFHPDARAAGIPDAKGVLLVGVSGCGKSLAARASADALHLPLVRFDPGRLFGSTVGESEANLRRACETAERLAPVVVWIDEIEKVLAGSEGAASDAGTTARVVGGLLTWMAERTRPVFVVATANDTTRLPAELWRRGRFDETFFVDLPSAEERLAITRIHLYDQPRRRCGASPPCADAWEAFAAVADAAEGYSGADLEAALVEARLDAFAEARPVAAGDFSRALAAAVPLSRSHAASVSALRRWAETSARRA